MVFSTPFFLTVFLPAALAGVWILGILAPRFGAAGLRPWLPANAFILLCSLWFYFWGEGWGVLWLLLSVTGNAAVSHVMMLRPGRAWRKGWLSAAVAGNLAFLGWFKYAAFTAGCVNMIPGVSVPVPEVALPLGISFYTFQAMSYVVDVYRGEVPPARNFIDFACYVTMFPQLVAGPIVRYADVASMLERRHVGAAGVASGFRRFLYGLAKKVLIANTVASMADGVWEVIGQGHGVYQDLAALGLLCYTLQIYYDFSGYSDMAIGLGRMMGFEFRENFLHPYCSSSVREFWRRWHISLSTWFRDYLYIPLGGSRKGTVRTALNCVMVFALCGLWHGASVMFVVWGLWHGLFLAAERFAARLKRGADAGRGRRAASLPARIAGHVYTAAVFSVGWVLFRSETMSGAMLMLKSIAGTAEVSRESRALWLDCTPAVIAAMCAGVFFAYPVVPLVRRFLLRRVNSAALVFCDNAAALFLGFMAAVFTAGGAYNPFLYFRF